MLKKVLYLLPLFAGVPLFLTGALRRPASEAARPIAPGFVAQPITWTAPTSSATELLDLAVDRLAPERLAWLNVTVWQRMAADVAFEAEGALQLGPNHCARLDLQVRSGGSQGQWLVVSDGHAMAHVVQMGKSAPTVTTRLFADDGDSTMSTAEALQRNGCGGPYPLLKDLQLRMHEHAAETGLLHGHPAVRIQGRLDATQTVLGAAPAVAADFCYLYLDPQTLWPCRMEWRADGVRERRLVLEMEFRAPQINCPLSLPECIRAFSYRPDPG